MENEIGDVEEIRVDTGAEMMPEAVRRRQELTKKMLDGSTAKELLRRSARAGDPGQQDESGEIKESVVRVVEKSPEEVEKAVSVGLVLSKFLDGVRKKMVVIRMTGTVFTFKVTAASIGKHGVALVMSTDMALEPEPGTVLELELDHKSFSVVYVGGFFPFTEAGYNLIFFLFNKDGNQGETA